MGTTPQIVARPPAGEIVTQERLVLAGRGSSTLNLSRGFGGVANPSTIWDQMVRDSQTAYAYYRELEEKDDDLGGALEEMALAVLRRDRQVTPADESNEAARVAAFVQEQLARVPDFDQVLEALLEAPGYGVSIAEVIYDVVAGQVGLIDIKDRPQELFTFAARFEPQIGPLRFLRNAAALEGELVPEQKFLIFTYRPRSGNRRGRPLLRSTFWLSWFKRQVLRFWLRFGEKGPGTAAVQYRAGATQDERDQALAAAEAFVENVAVAVPENIGLMKELLTSARAQNPAVYSALYDRLAANISRRIQGQTLTSRGSEQGQGSRSMGDVHAETKEERVDAIARKLETVINDQLIRPLVLWNFGPNVKAPKWSVLRQEVEDLNERSQVDDRLQKMGVAIPKSYALEKYGIPEVKDGDEVLEPRAAAPSPFGGGMPAEPEEFADDGTTRLGPRPQAVQDNAEDLRRLMKQLRNESLDAYRLRVMQLAQEAFINQGGRMQDAGGGD